MSDKENAILQFDKEVATDPLVVGKLSRPTNFRSLKLMSDFQWEARLSLGGFGAVTRLTGETVVLVALVGFTSAQSSYKGSAKAFLFDRSSENFASS